MIINAQSICLTLVIVSVACYGGLTLVRQFALSIAQENHDALKLMDAAEDEARLKRERLADDSVATALAKVQPILTQDSSATAAGGAPLNAPGSVV